MSRKHTSLLMPKLRFPEFKDEWEEKRLGEVGTFYKGKGISKTDIDKNGVTKCIRYGELYTTYGEVIDEVYSKTNMPHSELFLSSKNDVIIPSSGETKIDIARASCVQQNNIALGGDLTIIRTKLNGVFLSYYLNSAKKYEIASIAQGDTVVHLYATKLIQIKILFPQKPEQQKIADCLSSLDDLITAEDKKLAALKKHKKGLMQKLFPAEGKTVPELRFSEFRGCGEWEVKTFNNFIKLYRGSSPRPIQDYLTRSNGVNWIKIGDTKRADGFNICSAEEQITQEGAKKSRFVKSGELILANSMSFGKTYELKISGYIYDGWFVLREYEKHFNKNFLLQQLNSDNQQKQYESLSAGGIVLNISSDIVYSTILKRPSLPEQKKIADCLSSLDDLITAQAEKIEKLKVHKKGLMQGLFPSAEEVSE